MKLASKLDLILAIVCLLLCGALAHGQASVTTQTTATSTSRVNGTWTIGQGGTSSTSAAGALRNLGGVGLLSGVGVPSANCSATVNTNYLFNNTAQQVYLCGSNNGTWGWFLLNPPPGTGPAGPAGATGPQGPAGPVGPQGPAGADGTATCPTLTNPDGNLSITPLPAPACGYTINYVGPGSGQPGGDPTVQLPPISYSALIAIHPCTGTVAALSPDIGRFAIISDSTVNSLGQLITVGNGTFVTPAVCNGVNWMVE